MKSGAPKRSTGGQDDQGMPVEVKPSHVTGRQNAGIMAVARQEQRAIRHLSIAVGMAGKMNEGASLRRVDERRASGGFSCDQGGAIHGRGFLCFFAACPKAPALSRRRDGNDPS